MFPYLKTCLTYGSEQSIMSGGPMNILPPQDCSKQNKLLGDVGLLVFTRVAIFSFGGFVESFLTR